MTSRSRENRHTSLSSRMFHIERMTSAAKTGVVFFEHPDAAAEGGCGQCCATRPFAQSCASTTSRATITIRIVALVLILRPLTNGHARRSPNLKLGNKLEVRHPANHKLSIELIINEPVNKVFNRSTKLLVP